MVHLQGTVNKQQFHVAHSTLRRHTQHWDHVLYLYRMLLCTLYSFRKFVFYVCVLFWLSRKPFCAHVRSHPRPTAVV